jgi:hypothetical protein
MKSSNSNITSYKYNPELQNALFDFIGTIEDVYGTFELKLSDEEKSKIKKIREKRNES